MISPLGLFIVVLGSVVLWRGFGIGHSVRKAEFLRRNSSGVQGFASYEEMVKITRREKITDGWGAFIRLAGILIIMGGSVNLILSFMEHLRRQSFH